MDSVEDGIEVADGLHGLEGGQVGLDLGPLLRIVLGGDGRLGVGVVVDEVVLDLGGDGLIGMLGQHGEEFGVGVVGEDVASGFYLEAGVEVAVGKIVLDSVEVVEHQANRSDGVVDALNVEVFGLLVRAFDGEEFERADLGEDKDEAGEEVAADAGALAVFFPIVIDRCLSEVLYHDVEIGAGEVGGEVLLVEDGFGAGDVGQEGSGGESVDAD